MDQYFDVCIQEAQKAYEQGDVPIGAIVVHDGEIISYAHNIREKDHKITGHAEIEAILEAEKRLKRWNLADCDLYVTLEPCSMCKSVIQQARIANVYYLLDKLDYKKEYDKTQYVSSSDKNSSKNVQMYSKMLSNFFKTKR